MKFADKVIYDFKMTLLLFWNLIRDDFLLYLKYISIFKWYFYVLYLWIHFSISMQNDLKWLKNV